MPSQIAEVAAPRPNWPVVDPSTEVTAAVCRNPAVDSPPAASTKARTPSARSAGEAASVAGSGWPADARGEGPGRPGQAGSGGGRLAGGRGGGRGGAPGAARVAAPRSATSEDRVVDAVAVRPPSTVSWRLTTTRSSAT